MPSRVVTRMSNEDIKSLQREGHRLSLLQVHSPSPEALGPEAWVFRAFRISEKSHDACAGPTEHPSRFWDSTLS